MTGFYHFSVSIIGRGKGRSVVACAAYRSGEVIADERYGKTHDYSRRRGILSTGIVAPERAPDWASERERLWNKLEAFERRKDAQLAREFVLGLPHQLDNAQQAEIMREFIARELTPRGLVADWAIHAPNRAGDERNHHAHLMVAIRSINEDGFHDKKDRSLNSPAQLQQWRQTWAEIQNAAFERLEVRDTDGSILRVDERSFADRGIDIEPTQHMGVHATAMERRGIPTEIGDNNRKLRGVRTDSPRREAHQQFLRDRVEAQVERARDAHEVSEDLTP